MFRHKRVHISNSIGSFAVYLPKSEDETLHWSKKERKKCTEIKVCRFSVDAESLCILQLCPTFVRRKILLLLHFFHYFGVLNCKLSFVCTALRSFELTDEIYLLSQVLNTFLCCFALHLSLYLLMYFWWLKLETFANKHLAFGKYFFVMSSRVYQIFSEDCTIRNLRA